MVFERGQEGGPVKGRQFCPSGPLHQRKEGADLVQYLYLQVLQGSERIVLWEGLQNRLTQLGGAHIGDLFLRLIRVRVEWKGME